METITPKFELLFWPLSLLGISTLIQLIAFIDIMKGEFQGNEKTNWLLIVLLAPFIGPIIF